MHHHAFTTRSAARRVLVLATALAALAVAAPLANAARSHTLACQEDPGHWVSVTDEQGVSTLTLIGRTVCTQAVTGPSCSPASQRSPYPGWVQVTDEIGVPTLYKVGLEPTSTGPCVQTTTAETNTGPTASTTPQYGWPPLKSPYPGWVVVFDDQGVPTLEPISHFR
jgi:hypothetical protein